MYVAGYPIPGDASPALLAAAVAAGSSRVASLRPEAVDAAQARLMAALSATVGDDDRHARLRAIGLTGWSKDVISIDAAPGEGAQSADVASRTFAHARARVLVACAGEAERDAAVRSVEILAEIFPPAWLQQPGQTEMGMRLRSRASGTAAVRRRAMYAAAMCVGRWGEIVAERRYAESAEATAAAALREEAAVASEIVRLLEQKQGPARVVIS